MSKRISEYMSARSRRLRREAPVPERLLRARLRNRHLDGLKFRRQHVIGPYIADFHCAQAGLVVELDGETHVGRGQSDAARTAYLKSRGLRVFRVTNDDLLQSPDAVTEAIMREARKAAPSPQPSPSRRERG